MKKFFFFKSSASSNGPNNLTQTQSKEKQVSKADQGGPFLRRSRSYSSGTVHDSGLLRTQSDSPCSSSSNISRKQSVSRSSRRALTPERHSRAKWFEDTPIDNVNFAGIDTASTESSSNCSTNASNKVLDRYIDGEQHQEWSFRHHAGQNGGGKRPPRAAPAPPADGGGGLTHKPRAHSFRDPTRESKLYMSTRDWVENGAAAAHESPRKLAKQVVERLSQSRVADSREFDHDVPITIEDIYGGSRNGLPPDEDDESEVAMWRAELDSRTRKLEREKNELQAALEKEFDRRSTEWSMKLEKYQTEERRLRERVRELAEQNVSLQREVSMFGERELDHQNNLVRSGQQVNELTSRIEELTHENRNLNETLSELGENHRAAEEDRDCFKRNYADKEKECKELHRAVARLLRTCNEQEKTVEGLRAAAANGVGGEFDTNHLSKVEMELLRLTGVEQAVRKEAESWRLEANSLRHENINLLNRLKGGGGGLSGFRLDQELWDRVDCLRTRATGLINDSVQLSAKLLENVKERSCVSSLEAQEALKNGLDHQFVVEADVKLQGFKRGAESLTRSLQTVSDVLHEKSRTEAPHHECSEDVVKSDLKAEALMTSLLREKLCAKEADVEQLQAELAAAVRGNDILRSEVQNAMDNLSCITHKMKDLEIQLIKKDETIYRLQTDVQECRTELKIVNGILPKVSEERDMIWEEMKQYSENNMLLSSELGALKKKVEALDEDVLLKEGQITILKDALGKPFDLLSSPVSDAGFLLQ